MLCFAGGFFFKGKKGKEMKFIRSLRIKGKEVFLAVVMGTST